MSFNDISSWEARVKRIQYHQYGGPAVMRLEDFEPTRPGSGGVLVRVRAAAANPMDWGIRSGAMKMVTGRKFPRAMGHDFAGVVEAVGERLRAAVRQLGPNWYAAVMGTAII